MTPDQIKERYRSLLLDELRNGKREWYFISIATDDEFLGGYFLQAYGAIDANSIMHALGWWTKGSTQTSGPIDIMERVPDLMRWRKLSKQEVESL